MVGWLVGWLVGRLVGLMVVFVVPVGCGDLQDEWIIMLSVGCLFG